MKKVFRIIGRCLLVFGGIYTVLFAVFFFDLDGKAIFHGVEPMLVKHYDKMKRRDPLQVAYDTDKPHVDYGTK